MLVTATVSQDSSPELQPTTSPTVSSNPFSDEDVGDGKGNEGSEGSGETMSPVTAPTLEPTSAPIAAPTLEPTSAPIAAPTLEPTWAPIAAPTLQPTVSPKGEGLYHNGKGKGNKTNTTCYIGEHHCPCTTEGTCDVGFVCDEHDLCHLNRTCYLGEHHCPCTADGMCDVGLVCDERHLCHLNHSLGQGKGNDSNVIECYIGSSNCPCSTGGTCDPGFRCSLNHTCLEDLVHNLSGYNYFLSGQSYVPETIGYVGLSLVVCFFIVLAGFKLLKMYVAHKSSCYDGVDMEDVNYVKAR